MPRGKATAGTCSFCEQRLGKQSVVGHLRTCAGWRGDEIPMSRRAESAFRPGVEITHIYEFGTESETRIRVVGEREGKPLDRHPLALLARNEMPAEACIECGEPATVLCVQCVSEYERWGVLCASHEATHPHDDYGDPLRLVNSPRMGLCGYSGPADPPYGWGRAHGT